MMSLKLTYNATIKIFIYLFAAILITNIFGCSTTHEGGVPNQMQFAPLPLPTQQPIDYHIKPGDQLDIKFFYNPELNMTIFVNPDGKISLQLIGEVVAAGLKPSELEAKIKAKSINQLREPVVTIMVKGFAGQQVFVDGEVEHPGVVDIGSKLTAWQAIIKAGGFKDTATRESVILLRQNAQNQVVPYRIDLTSSALDQPHTFFQLQPSDVIFVPKTWIAEQDKFVEQYIEKLFLFKGWYFTISPVTPFL